MRSSLILLSFLLFAACARYQPTVVLDQPAVDDGYQPLAGFECQDGSIGPTRESCRAMIAEAAPPTARPTARAVPTLKPAPVAYTPALPPQLAAVASNPSPPPPTPVASAPAPQPDKPASPPASSDTKAALTAAAIAALIVQESRGQYYSTGHPCACPDDRTRNGRSCGNMSAYIRPGGAHPLCYPRDVTAGMIADYRSKLAQQ